jgi:hypothetical protein
MPDIIFLTVPAPSAAALENDIRLTSFSSHPAGQFPIFANFYYSQSPYPLNLRPWTVYLDAQNKRNDSKLILIIH